MADQAKQTPLVELLDAVPEDVRIGVQDGEVWHAGVTWHPVGRLCHEAAAEPRRLVAENESLKQALAASCDEERDQLWEASPGGGCFRARSAEAVNRELLEALKDLEKEFRKTYPIYYYAEPWGHETNVPLQAARAAIAKAEVK
jgi:hypothetical protein